MPDRCKWSISFLKCLGIVIDYENQKFIKENAKFIKILKIMFYQIS